MNVMYRTPIGNKPILDTYYEENGLIFGISSKQIYEALLYIEELKSRAMEMLSNHEPEGADKNHEEIVKVTNWLKRNGYEH